MPSSESRFAYIPPVERTFVNFIVLQLAGLCGSDLHIYRGHEDVDSQSVHLHSYLGLFLTSLQQPHMRPRIHWGGHRTRF